jgi:hypothetical protein
MFILMRLIGILAIIGAIGGFGFLLWYVLMRSKKVDRFATNVSKINESNSDFVERVEDTKEEAVHRTHVIDAAKTSLDKEKGRIEAVFPENKPEG